MSRTILSSDCWSTVFSFCEPDELLFLSTMNKEWKKISDSHSIWKIHCRNLWNNKQNLYLERWVNITKIHSTTTTGTRNPISSTKIYMNQIIEQKLQHLITTEHQMTEYYHVCVEMSDYSNNQLESMKQDILKLRKAIVTSQNVLIENDNTSISYQQVRGAMPCSQYILVSKIQQERDLTLMIDSLMNEETSLFMSKELSVCFQQPIVVCKSDIDELESQGLLLTWKQSYLASLRDSLRTYITYEVCIYNYLVI
jgi:hypothetical protein